MRKLYQVQKVHEMSDGVWRGQPPVLFEGSHRAASDWVRAKPPRSFPDGGYEIEELKFKGDKIVRRRVVSPLPEKRNDLS